MKRKFFILPLSNSQENRRKQSFLFFSSSLRQFDKNQMLSRGEAYDLGTLEYEILRMVRETKELLQEKWIAKVLGIFRKVREKTFIQKLKKKNLSHGFIFLIKFFSNICLDIRVIRVKKGVCTRLLETTERRKDYLIVSP